MEDKIEYKTVDLGEFGEIEIPEAVDIIADKVYDHEKVHECIEAISAVFEAYGANLFEVIKTCQYIGESAKAIMDEKAKSLNEE